MDSHGLSSVTDWLELLTAHLPIPVLVVQENAKRVVAQNKASARLPWGQDGYTEAGPVASEKLVAHLLAKAREDGGMFFSWGSPRKTSFRVYARALPADGRPRLVLLTFIETPDPEEGQRALRDALEIRDEFFSVATHELKDPLFAMQLSLQLLRHATAKQGPLPPYLAHHLDVSTRQSDRLSRLIDNLLDVSRIRSGRVRLDAETFDLAELVREVVARFHDSASAAGCSLTCEATEQVIGYFDRSKVDQILSNLLTNAVKYGPGQPVVVRVVSRDEDAVMEVQDHGRGIDPADQDRIFTRFERASKSHRKESLGLGLFIVRALVEAHGGDVSVSSQPGQGATFLVTMPRNRLHHKKDASDGERGSSEKGETT